MRTSTGNKRGGGIKDPGLAVEEAGDPDPEKEEQDLEIVTEDPKKET